MVAYKSTFRICPYIVVYRCGWAFERDANRAKGFCQECRAEIGGWSECGKFDRYGPETGETHWYADLNSVLEGAVAEFVEEVRGGPSRAVRRRGVLGAGSVEIVQTDA